MGIIKDCPRGSTEKCTDKYGCQGACAAVEQFEKEWREEQEPVAWMTFNAYGEEDDIWYENPEGNLPEKWTYKPLYTTPQKKEWVGLTAKDLTEIPASCYEGAIWADAKLKEKNT